MRLRAAVKGTWGPGTSTPSPAGHARNPWRWRRPSSYFRRNHRKVLVIDEAEAFLGGFNMRLENSRALFGDARQRDTHVSVRGELVRLAAVLFDRAMG